MLSIELIDPDTVILLRDELIAAGHLYDMETTIFGFIINL